MADKSLNVTDGYSYDELRPLVSASLAVGLSVLLRGHPGVGKSALAHEMAGLLGLPLQDIRLAQREPAELCGVYFPDRDKQLLQLLPPDWVRAVCAQPGFVFLDEINAAVTRLHQAAAYQIVLERRVGPFAFHPKTVVMAAGNLEEDQALVAPLSSALNNRFVHFRMRVDADAWLHWGEIDGIHPAILAYVASQGSNGARVLYEPNGDDAFPTPRSWAMASRLLHGAADEKVGKRLVAACVGAAAAEKLYAYLRIWRKVNPEAIVVKGKALALPDHGFEPSFVYAAMYAVADWVTVQPVVPDAWLPNLLKFLQTPGLDAELQWLCLRRLKSSGVVERLKAMPSFRLLATDLVRVRAAVYP